MSLLGLWRLTRAHPLLLVACATAGLLLAFGWSLTRPVEYTADSSAYVVAAGGDGSISSASSGDELAKAKALSYLPLLNSRAVAARVIEQLHLDETPEEIAKRFSGDVPADSTRIDIKARGSSPERARDLATAVINAVAAEAADLENTGTAKGDPTVSAVSVEPFESATLPTRPSSPNYLINLPVGAVLGLLIGYGIAVSRRLVDSKVRDVADVESRTGRSVIGVIPKSTGMRVDDRARAFGPALESMRQLRTNLRYVDVDNPPRSIVVTSANAGEGKSTLSSTLGRLLADAGTSTVIVDADLRRPRQADIWGLDAAAGLTQVLAGDLALEDVLQDTEVEGLRLLPAGRIPPNPSELLGSHRMREVIEKLSRDHLVLLDVPPLLPVTDAGLLSAQSDGAILVFAVGSTHREQVGLCQKTIDQLGAKTLGVVLNMAPERGMGAVVYGYGYSGYRQDYYRSGGGGKRAGERKRLRLGRRSAS